jgi:protein phosphatase 1G
MGNYLQQPNTRKESRNGSHGPLEWGVSSMQGWRTDMEDSDLSIGNLGDSWDGVSLFAVYDGHGGKEVAHFCEQFFPPALRKNSAEDMHLALTRSFHRMDEMLREPEGQRAFLALKKADGDDDEHAKPRQVKMLANSIRTNLAEAREKGSLSREEAHQVMMKMVFLKRLEAQPQVEAHALADNVGCTANVVLMTRDKILCANCGDSRAVLCRAGRALELSHDHKPNHEIEKRRIEKAGGYVEAITGGPRAHYRVNGNLNLSRALGDLEYKKRYDLGPEAQIISGTPDIIEKDLCDQDEFVVVACDGVWDVMTNQEVVDFVRSRLPTMNASRKQLSDIVEELLDKCMSPDPKETQGLGCDNMTCVVVEIKKGRQ